MTCERSIPTGTAERAEPQPPTVRYTDRRGEVTGQLVEVSRSGFVASIAAPGRGVVHCWLGGHYDLERVA